jgi:hypothetical protein
MTDLILRQFKSNDGTEIVINTQTHECYASQSALARMCDVSETAIRKWVTSNQIVTIEAQIPTSTGLKTSNLLDEPAIYDALAKYNSQLLCQFAKAGLRMGLHHMAGYEIKMVPAHHDPFEKPIEVSDRSKVARAFRRPSTRQLCSLQDLIWGNVASEGQVAMLKAKVVADYYPELEGAARAGFELLPKEEPEEQTFTPTQIGEMLEPKLSAVKLNQRLEDLGLQTRAPRAKGGFDWATTPAGADHALLSFVAKSDGTPKQSLRWKSSVLPLLEPTKA